VVVVVEDVLDIAPVAGGAVAAASTGGAAEAGVDESVVVVVVVVEAGSSDALGPQAASVNAAAAAAMAAKPNLRMIMKFPLVRAQDEQRCNVPIGNLVPWRKRAVRSARLQRAPRFFERIIC
jgi:hypothetical protein